MNEQEHVYYCIGLRDHLAGCALSGLLALIPHVLLQSKNDTYKDLAELSYFIADKMMEAREGKK